MGIQAKSLIAHLRARQEEYGVKAFCFHHVLWDNRMEPAVYQAQEQPDPNSTPEYEEGPSTPLKSDLKLVPLPSIPPQCPDEDIIMEMVDIAPGNQEHNRNCKKEELGEEPGLNSSVIWSLADTLGMGGDAIHQGNRSTDITVDTDSTANSSSDIPSSQHIPPFLYHPPPHIWTQHSAPSLQNIPNLSWPQIPANTPVSPDPQMARPPLHAAYQQFLAFCAAQQAHESLIQPGPYQPPAPFMPVMPFAPPYPPPSYPPPPVTPAGPSHHKHSMDPDFRVIDCHLIPPGNPPFSSSIKPYQPNQTGAHIMNPIPAILINPPTLTLVKRTPKRKRMENDSPVKTPTRSGRKRQPTRKLLESQGGSIQ